jgi:hypothetical protein
LSGINTGLGYAVLKGKDTVGLWQEPEAGNDPYKSAAFSDLLATTLLITWLSTVIATPGIRKAMKEGKTVPVEGTMLRGGCLTISPVRMLGTCTRSLLLSLWATVVIAIPFILLMTIVCAGGGMHGEGSQCYMPQVDYIWLKGVYAGFVAMLVYPFILLSAINTQTIPQLDLTLFLDAQKERWAQQQRNKDPAPL